MGWVLAQGQLTEVTLAPIMKGRGWGKVSKGLPKI